MSPQEIPQGVNSFRVLFKQIQSNRDLMNSSDSS